MPQGRNTPTGPVTAAGRSPGRAAHASAPADTRRHERHFYSGNRAFGRFGMRIFEPRHMDSPHWHGHVEANFISGARLVYDIDGDRVEVPENRLAVFWAGIPHQLTQVLPTGDGPVTLANIYLPLDAFLLMGHIGQLQLSLLGGALALLPQSLCDQARIRGWYADYRRNEVERLELVKMELNALLRRGQLEGVTLLREPLEPPLDGRVLSSVHSRKVIEMVRFILENLTEPICNADVARVAGLHQNYALTLFSRTMRLPMKRFIIRMRLLQARALLMESEMAIARIAQNSGFSSTSQFYEHFKSAYAMSPKQMRQKYTREQLK